MKQRQRHHSERNKIRNTSFCLLTMCSTIEFTLVNGINLNFNYHLRKMLFTAIQLSWVIFTARAFYHQHQHILHRHHHPVEVAVNRWKNLAKTTATHTHGMPTDNDLLDSLTLSLALTHIVSVSALFHLTFGAFPVRWQQSVNAISMHQLKWNCVKYENHHAKKICTKYTYWRTHTTRPTKGEWNPPSQRERER